MAHDKGPRGGDQGPSGDNVLLPAERPSDTAPQSKPQPRRGGKRSRQKGDRAEREVVAILQEAGLAAERVPLSGAAGGRFSGDVTAPVLGRDEKIEVKCRANAAGFSSLYKWLSEHFAVVVRRDRDQPLICLRLKDFARLAVLADRGRRP